MKPLTLEWQGDMKFRNRPDSPAMELHSATPGVTSPPEALAYAVAGCMAMDVVHVIRKGRYPLEAMAVTVGGERAHSQPRRFTALAIHFEITGDVPPHVVDRAIELSRAKYCSVWNTIRPDVTLTTDVAIRLSGSDAS
jgi:uncharacterized OsmC-like protein